MTPGVDEEARLAALADDVHRAREAESQRQIARRRSRLAFGVLALLILVAVLVAVVRPDGDSGSTEAAPVVTSSTASTTIATTSTTVLRPTQAPPEGTTPDPGALLVLLDRKRNLPPGWAPTGLVQPKMAWATTDAIERRLLRPDAAAALDRLALAAARDGAPIIGISAFRSQQSQQQVYDRYVRKEGAAAASRFSAAPGHSEHQTGLAVDVTGADGTCPTEPCFGTTPQAAWLAAHAPEHGFIVRYPAGKELITTYQAEPWHLRYVGVEAAQEMQRTGLTLDEYLRAA